jgi:3-hydroxyisobutyrate dehydrogenase-like beta-hydroxyacid dehydrogenase
MGSSIVRLLLGAGYDVAGYDVRPEALKAVTPDGAQACASMADLAARAKVVITSLPSSDALDGVASALLDERGLVDILIEASTLGIEDKERARNLLDGAGIRLLDCPISGTGAQMRSGDAITYASGDPELLEQCMPVLMGYSRRVLPLGEFGNGSRLKLVANHLVAVHNVAAAEAVALAMRLGLDPPSVLAALTEGAGTSRMLEVRGPMMVERSYQPATMRVDLFGKDLALIADLARRSDAATPLFDASVAVYIEALSRGHAADDTASVMEVLIAPPDQSQGPQ